jgi:hypothetical protein
VQALVVYLTQYAASAIVAGLDPDGALFSTHIGARPNWVVLTASRWDGRRSHIAPSSLPGNLISSPGV